MDATGFRSGFANLFLLSSALTRSISAENPTGEPGGGCQAIPEGNNPATVLGKGWKARPCITLRHGEETTIADIKGPGIIQHMWITGAPIIDRNCVLRMYWDGEETASVEVPLADFFANGHGLRYNVNSLPVACNPTGGFNCYWPMPFRESARITVDNMMEKNYDGLYYQITYSLQDVPEPAAYLHAQWRRATSTREDPVHVILDGVKGQGHYVGTSLAWTQLSNGWWGEGEIKFYMDGDTEYPTICGTGTEDYFGGAWCFAENYSTPFLGYPLFRKEPGEVPKHGVYRWHIMDPIRFRQDLRVTIQTLTVGPGIKFAPIEDDIASTAYWYQSEPHAAFPVMPGLQGRFPR